MLALPVTILEEHNGKLIFLVPPIRLVISDYTLLAGKMCIWKSDWRSLGLIMSLTWKKDKVGDAEGGGRVMSLRDELEEKWSALL